MQQQLLLDQLLLPSLDTPLAQARLLQAVQAWFQFTSLTESFAATQALFTKEAAFMVDLILNDTTRAQTDAEVLAADPLYATPSGFILATLEGAWFLRTVVEGQSAR